MNKTIPGARPPTLRGGHSSLFLVLFLVPSLAVYMAMVTAPTILSLAYSLTNYSALAPQTSFVGLDNYAHLARDRDFHQALRTTLLLTVGIVTLPNVLGLGLALLLNAPSRIYRVLRLLFFAPQVLSAVIVSFVWATILTDQGLLNAILSNLGLAAFAQSWLGDPSTALVSIVIVVSWQAIGFCTVVYLAVLQTVPDDLLAAAEVDGAGPIAKFRHVTWPLIAPAVTVNTVLLLIGSLKLFDQVVVLTSGGPAGLTETIAFRIVYTGFTANQAGYASAMAIVLFLVIGVMSTIVVRWLRRREVEY